jgi:hypothetical protein
MAIYNRKHYEANKPLYKKRARDRKVTIVRERMGFLVDVFRRNPCVDCGEADPLVLEFDHLEKKLFNIAEALPERSWSSILAEMAKCEVVCANCHRRRTAVRGGFARVAAAKKT